MDRVLNNFIVSLRGAGVPVSVSESIDAARGPGDLRIQRPADRQEQPCGHSCEVRCREGDLRRLFREVLYLPDPGDRLCGRTGKQRAAATRGYAHSGHRGDDQGGRPGRNCTRRPGCSPVRGSSVHPLFHPARDLHIEDPPNTATGSEPPHRFVADLYRQGGAGASAQARQLEQGRDALIDMVRRFVEEQYEIYARESTERIIERYLWDVRLTELEERHYDRMHFLIRKLVKRMNERYSRRRRRAKRGALDFTRLSGQTCITGAFSSRRAGRKSG